MNYPVVSARLAAQVKQLQHSKSERERLQRFVVEGAKGVAEMLASNLKVLAVVGTDRGWEQLAALRVRLPKQDAHSVDEAGYTRMSALATPPGILALVQTPQFELHQLALAPTILALDGITDPGNLGTLLRTADWFGVRSVLLGRGCVDITNPKVVQASMGSLTRVQWVSGELRQQLPYLLDKGWQVAACTLEGDSELPTASQLCIVIGSESHGIAPDLVRMATARYTIPGSGQTESLNAAVAGAIALHQRYAQLA